MSLQVIDNIKIKEPKIEGEKVKVSYFINNKTFNINFKYEISDIPLKYAEILSIMPIVNYSLFTKKIIIDFPISREDLNFMREVLRLNSVEIYVNKLIKRPEFFLDKIIPVEPRLEEANWIPQIESSEGSKWEGFKSDENSVAVMSSGGKESLLTYGIMKEIGTKVFPIYFNESGGHWRTAITAYRYMKETDANTLRIWSDIDRFYKGVNETLPIFRKGALKMWSDTYPIQLFIFPVYIFASLPYFRKFSVKYVMKGDEYDDPRVFRPLNGIHHYYGILDQTKFFDDLLNSYFNSVGIPLRFFSAVRHITGLVEEKILHNRYPELLKLQRSCHSCHFENGRLIPCGKCSKCNGILLFLLANNIDPSLLAYKEEDVEKFKREYKKRLYRLDESERDHAIYKISGGEEGKKYDNVEKIHICNEFCPEDTIPERFRGKIMKIFEEYTQGYDYCKSQEI